MGSTSDSDDLSNFKWESDEDEEGDGGSTCNAIERTPVEACEAGPSQLSVMHFTWMGFPEELVLKAFKENGGADEETILESIITFNAIKESSPSPSSSCNSDASTSDGDFDCNDFFDGDSSGEEVKGDINYYPHMDKKMKEIHDSSTRKRQRIHKARDFPRGDKQSWLCNKANQNKESHIQLKTKEDSPEDCDELTCHLPNPMVGFGLPGDSRCVINRKLPEVAIGPPYFYYENVALAPKGVWATISRFLLDVEPEFVDSKYFCAAARKRGYIHNLPLQNRFPLLPFQPKTIHEALPHTESWWPKWDRRTQLNCLQTCIGSARLTDRLRNLLARSEDPPPDWVQQKVLKECRKWNLVWVGRNKLAPLEPDEIEKLLGFPKNHTRGGGISRTERYRSLGNSFQIDTVAYHLSVLKEMFPGGMTVLSLFSGIGGAEVALHRLGIHLKAVVAVEISEINRNILRGWWEETGQTGTLIDIADVQQLNGDKLMKLIDTFGGFDLIIGGSPCNNLAGSNRVARDGLEGEHSSLFFEYVRILEFVRTAMGRNM